MNRKIWSEILEHPDCIVEQPAWVVSDLLKQDLVPKYVYEQVINHQDYEVLMAVANYSNTPSEILHKLIEPERLAQVKYQERSGSS